jgi:hypothetical protein
MAGGDAVFLAGRYAYAVDTTPWADMVPGVVYDISTPSAVAVTKWFWSSAGDGTYDIVVAGKHAYMVAAPNDTLYIYDAQGLDGYGAAIGSLEAGSLSVSEALDVGTTLSVRGGLNVGLGGLMTDGPLTQTGSLTFTNLDVNGVITAGTNNVQLTTAAGNLDATKLTNAVPAANLTNAVKLQASSPGTAQTGHFNISGTATANTFTGATFTGTGAVTMSSGSAQAFTLNSASGTVGLASGDSLTVPGSLTVASGSADTTTLSSTGTAYAGTARPVRTFALTPMGARLPASNAPTLSALSGNFTYAALAYPATSDTDAYWELLVPDSYAASTNVLVTLYYPTDQDCTAGTCEVAWRYALDARGTGETFDSTVSTDFDTPESANATAGILNVSGVQTVSSAGWVDGKVPVLRITRVGSSVTDDHPGNARLVLVRLEWTVDSESD